jgi:hypothetical protein
MVVAAVLWVRLCRISGGRHTQHQPRHHAPQTPRHTGTGTELGPTLPGSRRIVARTTRRGGGGTSRRPIAARGAAAATLLVGTAKLTTDGTSNRRQIESTCGTRTRGHGCETNTKNEHQTHTTTTTTLCMHARHVSTTKQ